MSEKIVIKKFSTPNIKSPGRRSTAFNSILVFNCISEENLSAAAFQCCVYDLSAIKFFLKGRNFIFLK